MIWLFIKIFSVLLLVLAGALIALFFNSLGQLIHRKNRNRSKSVPDSSCNSYHIDHTAFFYLAGSTLAGQANELQQTIPSVTKKFEEDLSKNPVGHKILQQLRSTDTQKYVTIAQSFFQSTLGIIGDVYVVLFLSLFFTASPGLYINGFLSLVPAKKREQARDVIHKTGSDLSKWLKGKLLAMLVVAVLTFIGLAIMNVPVAFALSIIAGILNFIPNFGPLIAMIPAAMVGLLQGPVTSLMIIALYIVVQVIESNFITPQIQKRLIKMPPALIIIAQVIMGLLTGGWGVLLATPLMAIIIVIVKTYYIKK